MRQLVREGEGAKLTVATCDREAQVGRHHAAAMRVHSMRTGNGVPQAPFPWKSWPSSLAQHKHHAGGSTAHATLKNAHATVPPPLA